MSTRRNSTCSQCHKQVWRSPSSRPAIICRDCRGHKPKSPDRNPNPATCSVCARTMRWAKSLPPVCSQCRGRRHRKPPVVPTEQQVRSQRTRRRIRAAQAHAARSARGTKGRRTFTQGACNWCGEQFLAVGSAPALYCTDHCAARAKRRRRITASFGGTGWTWTDFMRMAARFDYRCAYCHCTPHRLDADHVVPLARGGTDSLSNLLPACMPCNSDKRDLLLTEWADDRTRRSQPPRHTTCTGPQYNHLAPPPARPRHTAA